ncbi:MAG TPA: methyltransferase domain-containing protein [Myxococcaceae bacterium]|nr:methyltransferase domain-containing protein [Myxococcaceae bacterium]
MLEIGAVATTGGRSAQFLNARGARSVLACDADLGAVDAAQKAFASPDLDYRAEAFDDLKAGSFDLVLIADLAQCVRRPELVREVRRLLADQGFLLGGLRNPAGLSLSQLVEPEASEDAVTHERLVDVLAPCFSHLHIATQSPVLGYQLAFEQGEGLRVDGTFASTGEAAYLVVVAGQQPCPLFEPTWVQLPPEPLAYTGIGVAELAGAVAQLGVLSRELEGERTRARRLEQDVSTAARSLATLEVEAQLAADRAAEREQRVLEQTANARTLEGQLDEIKGAMAKVRDELAAERVRWIAEVERLEGERARLGERLEAAEADREALRCLVNGSKDREVELATALADRESKLEILHRRLAAQDAELASLRRSLPRSSLQVQQIYERATAELTALKAELFRRSESRPAQTGESDAKKG